MKVRKLTPLVIYKNLKVLRLPYLLDFTDEFVKGLTEYNNLKEIHLQCAEEYLLTEVEERTFGQLKSLESFGLGATEKI